MRRAILFGVLGLFAVAILVILAGGAWLLYTGAGARWALGFAGRAMKGATLEVREVHGALASPIELRGVRFKTPALELTAARFAARWAVSPLLWRRLEVLSLEADSVRIVTRASGDSSSARSSPPELPVLRAPLDIHLRHMALRGLDVRADGDTAGFTLYEARLAGRWNEYRLRLDTLAVRMPVLDAALRGEIGTGAPWRLGLASECTLRLADSLALETQGRIEGTAAAWRLAQRIETPFEGNLDLRGALDPHDLRRLPNRLAGRLEYARLEPRRFARSAPMMTLDGRVEMRGETIDRMSGTLLAHVRSDSIPNLDLDASFGNEGRLVRIDRLIAARPGKPGRIETRGWIGGLLPDSVSSPLRGDVTIAWRDLAWPLDSAARVRSATGQLRVKGVLSRYTLSATAEIGTRRLPDAQLELAATGDTLGLAISHLVASAPRESLNATGTLAWRPALRWDAAIAAHGLDPGLFWPEWPGQISLAGRVRGAMLADSLHDFEAHVTRLGGMLRGYPLGGGGDIAIHGEDLALDSVRVTWGGARLDLAGERGDGWNVRASLEAPSLAVLDTLASGRLSATVAIEGPVDTPRARITAHGDSIGYQGETVDSLVLSAAAGLRADDSTQVALDAWGAVLGGIPLERVALGARGTTAQHTLAVSAFTERESLFTAVAGGLDHASWRGALQRLDFISYHAGRWSLAEAVPVSASAESVTIAPFDFRSGDGSLRGHGAWSTHHGWYAEAALTRLPLALLDPLLPNGMRAVGRLEGRLAGRAAGERAPVEASAELTPDAPALLLVPAARGRADTLGLRSGKLAARMDVEGLNAELQLETLRQGRLSARIGLPGLDPYAADQSAQPLTGHIEAGAGLDLLGTFVTGIREPRGRFDAALDLSGTLGRPELAGQAHVKDGAVTLPAFGVTYDQIQLDAEPRGDGGLALRGGARSKNGNLDLEGGFEPRGAAGPAVKLQVRGKDVTLMDTRESQVRVSPDLAVEWAGAAATVSGTVEVPFARLQISSRSQTAQEPSADVVFVGAQAESTGGGLMLTSRVRVVVGSDVEVRGTGYRVKPEGSVLVIDQPDEATRATGQLEIKEGSYKAYGQDLTIERGRVIFGGGPITNPGLDVRATRTADDGTVAGIQISNTLKEPVLQLFSSPAKSDQDVLSYIMSGKPVESGSGDLGKKTGAALGMQGGSALAGSLAGQVGLGEASVESAGSTQEASLFLGTYLSPRLYMAYGIGLFEDVHTIRLRYSVASRWSVQAESGKAQSGIIQYRGER